MRALAISPFVGQRLTMLAPKEHYTVIAVEKTYPLSEMPDAMRQLVAGHVRGKLVITIGPTSDIDPP